MWGYFTLGEKESRLILFVKLWSRSQFGEEYLNGRNSLIFTWNKQQRVIHEEDLLHHYDPNQRRQKVEDQPCRRMGQIEAKTPPPLRSIEVIPSFGRCYSTLGERQYELKLPRNPKSSPHHLKGKSSAADPGDTIPRRTPSCCLPEKFRSLRRDILSERWPSNMAPWISSSGRYPSRDRLLCRFRNNPSAGVRIIVLSNGKAECCTDPNSKEFSLDGDWYSFLSMNNSYWKLMFAMERCLLKTLLYSLIMETCVSLDTLSIVLENKIWSLMVTCTLFQMTQTTVDV